MDLRNDLQNQLQLTNVLIEQNRGADLSEKGEIKNLITELEQKTDDFRQTYDDFTDEVTKLDE